MRAARLRGNLGYLRVDAFEPPAKSSEPMDRAMGLLSSTDGLIIDLRWNSGGSAAAVAYLCSFFFAPGAPVHLNDLVRRKPSTNDFTVESYWTKPVPVSYLGKPVYVLTSARTISGGEEFAYDLQTQGRAVLVGERTKGGANPGRIVRLGDRFAMFIPNGRARNPITKANWEGVGVRPDKATSSADSLAVAARLALRSGERPRSRATVRDGAELSDLLEADLMNAESGTGTP